MTLPKVNKDLLEISGKDTLLEFRLQHNKRRPSDQEEIRSDFEMNEYTRGARMNRKISAFMTCK